MLSRFNKIAPIVLFIFSIILAAKLTAVIIDALLPPLPRLECITEGSKPAKSYPFASAFSLKSSAVKKSAPPLKALRQESLKGYTLTMTAIGKPSMALVAKGGKSKFLSVGERIDGFRLEEVFTDRVKFVKNGKEYWLFMKKSGSSDSLVAKPKGKREGSPEKELIEQVRREGDTIFIPRELLLQMHDLKKIFKYISINPVYKDNKLVGFGVANIKKGSVFDKMGLKRRDIIEKIDGKPIKSERDAFRYFNRLEELDSLSLTIKRGKESKELKYEIF